MTRDRRCRAYPGGGAECVRRGGSVSRIPKAVAHGTWFEWTPGQSKDRFGSGDQWDGDERVRWNLPSRPRVESRNVRSNILATGRTRYRVSFELNVRNPRFRVSGMLRRRAEKATSTTALEGTQVRARPRPRGRLVLVTDRRNDGGHLAKLASLLRASGTARIARSSGGAERPFSRRVWARAALRFLRWVSRRPRKIAGGPQHARALRAGRLTLRSSTAPRAVFAENPRQRHVQAHPRPFRPIHGRRRRSSLPRISLKGYCVHVKRGKTKAR